MLARPRSPGARWVCGALSPSPPARHRRAPAPPRWRSRHRQPRRAAGRTAARGAPRATVDRRHPSRDELQLATDTLERLGCFAEIVLRVVGRHDRPYPGPPASDGGEHDAGTEHAFLEEAARQHLRLLLVAR